MRAAASLTNALAAWASANSARELVGAAVGRRVGGAVLVDQRGRARQDAARGGEVDGVVGHLHPRARVAVDAPGEAAAGDRVGRLGDAERGRGMEQPGDQVALHVGQRVAGPEAAADTGLGQLDALERDRVAAGGAHAERVPVVVHDDAGRVGGHHRVRVALGALAVGVGDGDVEVGGGGGHRAEQLAAVDPPARLGAGGARAGAREVLAALADGGGEHDAVAGDLLERGGEAPRAALRPGRDRDLATALHVEHRDQVHVHADRDRGVAAREAARRDDEVVRGVDAEPAELDGDRRREVAGGLERVDRLERVAAVAVVLGRVGGELPGELLGDRHEAGAGVGMGCEFDRPWRRSVGRHLHGDGHAVGDHVVDGRALPRPLHDLAQLLLRRVARHAERHADALEPVARLVVHAERAAHVHVAGEASTRRRSARTLRAAAT